jgi:hypothetical protein
VLRSESRRGPRLLLKERRQLLRTSELRSLSCTRLK